MKLIPAFLSHLLFRSGRDVPPEVTGTEDSKEDISQNEDIQRALVKLGLRDSPEQKGKPGFLSQFRSSAELIPMIRRGFGTQGEEKEDEVAVGWKIEITNRKEREENLRDEVHRFEAKLKKFNGLLETGVEAVMWQLNRGSSDVAGGDTTDEFAVKNSNVTVQLHRRGDLFVQAVLTFALRGGYLSKAIGRNRSVDKSALEPLSLHDILEVRAGCSGFDHTELPSATVAAKASKSKSKTASKKASVKSENMHGNLFLTIKATPTPLAQSRSYIFRFKSRSARNDVMNALRSILADLQIREGVSISGLQTADDDVSLDESDIMVPLSAVHEAINRERESYDKILLLLLQGGQDLREKEEEMIALRSKLETVILASKEKDRVQANDSKLIMQLSKKLETLLMDNEDLRDKNDRLNSRLVTLESEHMNMSGR